MQTITYNTGRTYDAPQVLQITVESESVDEYGLTTVRATFTDASRHISGRVNALLFNDGLGEAVLTEYDAGRYEPI